MTKNSNHPLNILSASEIGDAISILKKNIKEHENSSFSYISLEEPDKNLLKENKKIERIVKIVGVDQKSDGFEVEINLSKKELLKEKKNFLYSRTYLYIGRDIFGNSINHGRSRLSKSIR